jgi:hypothetical protein
MAFPVIVSTMKLAAGVYRLFLMHFRASAYSLGRCIETPSFQAALSVGIYRWGDACLLLSVAVSAAGC